MCILKSFGGEEKTKVILLSNELRHCASSCWHFIFACYFCCLRIRTVAVTELSSGSCHVIMLDAVKKPHSVNSLNLNPN